MKQIMKQILKKAGFIALLITFSVTAYAAEDPWQASYTLEGKGMYSEAIKQVEQASNSQVNDELKFLRLGWLYYLQGDYSDAKKSYKSALEKNRQSIDARLGLYNQLVAQKRWREAATYNQEILDVAPQHLQANLNAMAVEEHNQDWEHLVRRATKTLRYFPTSADALIYHARANKLLGDMFSARRSYKKVLMLYPSNLEAAFQLRQNK